ncbi:MAG: hypothetical protein LBC82_00225 [Oscillospiraceae bacterium]|jgi:hypothetical protein|nr:hypothetical protein [Oscillospiraceae bacterium]
MGMPVIEQGTGTREQAITDIITSVALQEAALAHIMNAEGEKIQAIVATPGVTATELLELNDSVRDMLSSIAELEEALYRKLSLFADEIASGGLAAAGFPTSNCKERLKT